MSVPPELMAALQGGGGAPGGGGLPPELMAALGGGGDPNAGAPAGPDPNAPQSMTGDQGTPGGSDPFIRDAIDSLQQAAQAEADEQDIKTIMTCIANLQGVLANNQKDADAMMGGKASPAGMRKAAGAVAGG